MKQKSKNAFTLVELIVVITILAILGTIAFISLNGYAKSARNSSRLSDIKLIEKAFSILIQTSPFYPVPDAAKDITYSGGLAWTQGVFSSGVLSQVQRISNIPLDPLFGVPYSYSVSPNRRTYQIAGAFEGGYLSSASSISKGYAFENTDYKTRLFGNYISYDIPVALGTGCVLVAVPSILLSTPPVTGVINNNTSYTFLHDGDVQIPESYSGSITSTGIGKVFQANQVLDTCNINTIADLELYTAKISTAFSSLASDPIYQNLIFNSNSQSFQKELLLHLQNNGITINPEVIRTVETPPTHQLFQDSFNDSDATLLIGGHTPDLGFGSWGLVPGGLSNAYTISSNTLLKNGFSTSLIYPITNPILTSPNYNISFEVNDFAGGEIHSYLRYSNSNNFYKLVLSSSGYQIIQNVAGSNTVLQNINDPIAPGSTVIFSISGDTLVLNINGAEKENIVAGGISSAGNAVIFLQNDTASIDTYKLIYD